MKKIHYYSAIVLGLLILMWSLTGFVMIYHPFPRVQESDRIACRDILDTLSFSHLDSVITLLPCDRSEIKNICLYNLANRPLCVFTTNSGTYRYFADTRTKLDHVTDDIKEAVLDKWSGGSTIAMCDTLYSSDVWLLGGNIDDRLPIGKYVLDNDECGVIYLSLKTGEVLQYTTKQSRFWSCVGAIPHWLYITKLREKGGKSWNMIGRWLSGLSIIVCLSGIVLGLRYTAKSWRKRKSLSPFRKFWWRWHHISGLIFGFFLLLFLFSGFISFLKIPEWIIPVHINRTVKQNFAVAGIDSVQYSSSPDELIRMLANKGVSGISQIEYYPFGDKNYYRIYTKQEILLIDADQQDCVLHSVSKETVASAVASINRGEHILSADLLSDYDGVYISRRNRLPLPVVRVVLNDADGSRYYISPKTLQVSYFNTNTRWTRYLYHGLHRLEIPWSVKHPIVWSVVIWVLLIGSTLISITGFALWIYNLTKKRGR